MEFRIADTFTASLTRLTGDEQKLVKTTAFDLQMNPASPGLQFHKLDKARDKDFWSVRVNADIRLIVHRSENSLLLCYAAHHDKAYDWAERRKLETHPKTGAAQLVEIRESVRETIIPVFTPGTAPPTPTKPLFADYSDDELLRCGVPAEWLADVRRAEEPGLLALIDHLPAEAGEALLDLATGGRPRLPEPEPAPVDPFAHPDAQRRFRVMSNVDELARALEYPWDRWSVFLHPEQRKVVERAYAGPARVSGSAGTGKTVVALHRAVHLTRKNPDARVLLTTFSTVLANALRNQLRRLIGSEPRLAERIQVDAIQTVGERLFRAHCGALKLATRKAVREAIAAASKQAPAHRFSQTFLLAEWDQVVDAWQLDSWEAYRDVPRLGRRTRLPEPQRAALWAIYEQVRTTLAGGGMTTHSGMFTQLAAALTGTPNAPFDCVVVDESQDLSVAQLRFLASFGLRRADGLFFAGDLGQRIFQQPFSWKSLGVDIRGRARTLKVNYRTSHQIRKQADRLLGPEVADADGNAEDRSRTVSVFNGPKPVVLTLADVTAEAAAVGTWLKARLAEGIAPHECGLFVRSEDEIERAKAAAAGVGCRSGVLDDTVNTTSGQIAVGTMHLAKGLEFRAVVVMACDDEIIPSQARIETVGDTGDLEDVYNSERSLLYVACTRAREHLLVTGVEPESEFLDDLTGTGRPKR